MSAPSARALAVGLAAVLILTAAGLFGQAVIVTAKAALAPALLERAFERALEGDAQPRAWPWADTWPTARLIFPDGQRVIVLAEAGGEALAFGPAHLAVTVAPGDPGLSVIAAHRDTHFARLRHVRPGDAVEVERADGTRTRFVMTGSSVVRFDRSGVSPARDGPARLALVTCWPFEAVRPGPLRYVAWFEAERPGPAATASGA